MEKMTFFGQNGLFVGVWKENKHGDPQFFFHFLMDNDNMYKYRQFHCCKIIFTLWLKSKSGKNDVFWAKWPICGGVEGK